MSLSYYCYCEHCDFKYSFIDGGNTLIKKARQLAKDAALNGEYGEKVKNYLIENPDSFIDTFWFIYQCPECNNLKNSADKSVLQPTGQVHYVDFGDKMVLPVNDYVVALENVKKCDKCGVIMKKMTDYQQIRCPQCGNLLFVKEWGTWS